MFFFNQSRLLFAGTRKQTGLRLSRTYYDTNLIRRYSRNLERFEKNRRWYSIEATDSKVSKYSWPLLTGGDLTSASDRQSEPEG